MQDFVTAEDLPVVRCPEGGLAAPLSETVVPHPLF